MGLLKICGSEFFIDFKIAEKVLALNGVKTGEITDTEVKTIKDESGRTIKIVKTESTYTKGKEMDGFRFETITHMINILLSTDITDIEDVDKLPSNYKLALNTLMEYGILNIASK